ncbi:MAG: SRPBCC domain-containing protein, partial [Anaeromyxobacteraceae bacterium]
MVPDRIEREILIAAPLELVWAIVTEPEHIVRWFSDSSEVDLRTGGAAVFTWDKNGPAYARVEKVEPPHTFAFRWIRTGAQPRAGNSTLVEFTLRAEGENTMLRVVETGFRELD